MQRGRIERAEVSLREGFAVERHADAGRGGATKEGAEPSDVTQLTGGGTTSSVYYCVLKRVD